MHKRRLPPSPPPDSPPAVEWHSEANMRRQRTPPTRLEVWWHCCLLPGWQPIVAEQLALLKFMSLDEIRVCFLGANADIEAVKASSPVTLHEVYRSDHYQDYETATLLRLWNASLADISTAYLYFHTKGASAPHDPVKRVWRRAMARYLIADWRQNLEILSRADIVGANWQASKQYPHFQGNFWMARGDWISHLDNPLQHRWNGRHIVFAGQSWDRMHAECWLGSKPWHEMLSLVCQGHDWWSRPAHVDWIIPGFDYGPFDSKPQSPPLCDDEIRRLIQHPGASDRLAADMKAQVDAILAGCGCKFREKIDPLLPQLRPYFPAT